MKRSVLLFLFAAVALLLAGAFGSARLATRYRRQLQAQPAAVARWERQIERTRQQRDDIVQRLATARQQPAGSAPAIVDPTTPDPAQTLEVEHWVRQVKRLKQLFVQRPDQKIPEFAVLGDQDWLSLARRVQLDTEDNRQRACAVVRNAATNRFVQYMRSALEAYTQANHSQLPTDTAELQPYLFDPALDPAMLARYEMVRSGPLNAAPKGPVLEATSVMDDLYDQRASIVRNANGSLSDNYAFKSDPAGPPDERSLNDQIEYDVTVAVRAFVAAHPGALPKSPAELLPYFNPPLGPAMTEMINRPLTADKQKQFEDDVARMAGARR